MTALAGKPVAPALSFSVEGLSARDELLVKSLVRLLGHRTLQQWSFQANPAQAALRILDAETAAAQEGLVSSAPVLLVGRSDPGQGPFLRLPPHADEFERFLNDLGNQILQAPAPQAAAPEPSPLPLPSGGNFRLLRWPAATMLGIPWRTKLATLMVGQALPIEQLHQRSGVSLAECTAFVLELQHAGLVRVVAADNVAAAPAPEGRPMLAAALTATVAQAASPAVQVALAVATPPKAHPSLLARIRARLGFSTG